MSTASHHEDLSAEERQRYARHIRLPDIGEEGQKKLKAARVLIIGLGGLGAPASLYLAAAGVGTLGLVDADIVDLTNLQRQVLYATNDVGHAKTDMAQKRLSAINPHVRLEPHPQRLTAENALRIIGAYDIIIDGTDNFASHYLINDACVLSGKPLVYGSVHHFEGQVATVLPKRGPCYRCLYPEAPPPESIPSCTEAGVLGVVPGLAGMMQAMEVLKLILGIGNPLTGRILRIDSLKAGFREMTLARDPACAVCGDHPTIKDLAPHNEPQMCMSVPEITASELTRVLQSGALPFLLDVRNPWEYDDAHIEGAKLIPLPVLPDRLSELDPARDIIVYCHSGMRGAKAATLLLANGFARVQNLRGGIEAYNRMDTPPDFR